MGGRSGGVGKRCDFYDIASDGKQYVYAAVTRGVAKVDVFDIDTGSLVGSYPTCGSPHGVESRGYTVIDNTLGDVGYTTDRNQPYLFKIDLSEKKVTNKIELPGVAGGYEVAYSPVNQHVFIRSTVCCTCGFEGADKGPDCGRYGGDDVT